VDVNEYISSGAIEACVMGLADEQDWKELDQMAKLYPEVKEYREKLERERETEHLPAAIPVPSGLREKVFQSLDFKVPEKNHETPVVPIPAKGSNGKPLVVPLVPTPKPMKWLQRAVAVSVLLLMGSIILNFYFYSKSVSYQNQYKTLLVSQRSLMTKNQAMEAGFKMMTDPAVKQVVLPGTAKFGESLATVYWDSRSKDVYLMVNNLPKPSPEKQYQLWAIVDGKPVDAGMLEMDGKPGDMVHKMRNIPYAQAFAITLENKGGSKSPTMEAMYVMGKV
jgi:hypothetical protein